RKLQIDHSSRGMAQQYLKMQFKITNLCASTGSVLAKFSRVVSAALRPRSAFVCWHEVSRVVALLSFSNTQNVVGVGVLARFARVIANLYFRGTQTVAGVRPVGRFPSFSFSLTVGAPKPWLALDPWGDLRVFRSR
ncbi:unnamed protein product, partial [Ectocarpus sp. 4 AP-2014]